MALLPASALSAQSTTGYEVRSRAHRVALLELYTSEGCNSCPPTDRAGAGFVYTPQFLLDGRDLAQGWLGGHFADKIESINREATTAALGISQRLQGDTLEARISVSVPEANAPEPFVAVVESGLSLAVKAGENAGRLLQHDQVVHVLEGPLLAASRLLTIRLPSQWSKTQIGLVVFVQEGTSGKAQQALAAPLCIVN